jgi:hypothetical protein
MNVVFENDNDLSPLKNRDCKSQPKRKRYSKYPINLHRFDGLKGTRNLETSGKLVKN